MAAAKKKMSDSERSELMKKMDKDLEEHFSKLEAKAKLQEPGRRMEGGFSEENWEEEMKAHPFFNQEGWKDGEELSPMMQGMQELKYSPDENSPDELANNYKEDGNFNFKCKKYRFATASYTEGLNARSEYLLINTVLYTNRAAAQYRIGNYRSSFRDCTKALILTPTHFKAILRGAHCCFGLKDFESCKKWCDKGLKLDPKHEELLKLRTDAVRIAKEKERDERKRQVAEKKKAAEEAKVIDLLRARGFKIEQKKGGDLSLADLEPCHPAALHKPVHLDQQSGELVFPVLFLYPEIGETDFIEEWRESEALSQHIEVMFGAEAERPPWDTEGRYSPGSMVVYLETDDNKLLEISPKSSLAQAIKMPGFTLKAGTPNFIVFVRNCKSHLNFLEKYK